MYQTEDEICRVETCGQKICLSDLKRACMVSLMEKPSGQAGLL